LYKPTGQIVDFISSAGFEPDPSQPEPGNAVTWGVGPEGEYPESSWFAPESGGTVPIPPVEPPVDPTLAAKVAALEAQVAGLAAQLDTKADKVRVEAINTRFDNESKENVKKPLPDYVGSVRILGFTFNIVSRPR
jgi:hypothetical protein